MAGAACTVTLLGLKKKYCWEKTNNSLLVDVSFSQYWEDRL